MTTTETTDTDIEAIDPPSLTATEPETVLVLCTCDSGMRSYGGFRWPESGHVEAPDWDPAPRCGGGLHGLLWGEGDGRLLERDDEATRWLVVEAPADTVVDLGGKVKFPAGTVVYAGDRQGAVEMIQAHPAAAGRAVYRGTATAGDWGTATAGWRGTATAGNRGTATAGWRGTLVIHHYMASTDTYRARVAEVDGETILAGVAYRLNPAGEFAAVEAEAGRG